MNTNKSQQTHGLMKHIIISVILLTIVSCKVCYETKNSFNSAQKHTELTPVTVNELKEKTTATQADYTIMVIYNICNSSSNYINDVIIPYYNQQTDKEKINLIFVQKDCSSLKDVAPFFKNNNLGQTKYYIRDSSPKFSNTKGNANFNADRLANIIEYIYPNITGKIDKNISYPICLISDKHGNLKLTEYSYTDPTTGKTKKIVRPCPVHYADKDITKIDFKTTSQTIVNTPNDEKYFFYWLDDKE